MRALSRLFAAMIGLVLLVVGLSVALEVLLQYLAKRPVLFPVNRWLSYAREHDWSSGVVKATAGIILAVGILMLLVTLRRRKPTSVPGAQRRQLQVTFARRPLEAALGRLAERSGGVEGLTVRLRKRKVAVRGSSLATDLDGASRKLTESLSAGLGRLPLASAPTVDVKLKRADT